MATVRIVVVGDRNVGKTSLISTLVSDVFPANDVPRVMHPVVVRREQTPDNVQLTIIDTASSREHEDDLVRSLQCECDVVVLVADETEPDSLERVQQHWLPYFEQLALQVPVVLALNKSDMVHGQRGAVAGQFFGLVADKKLAACIEVSARDQRHVPDVFLWAQKAVLFPVKPLFNAVTKRLEERFVKALSRVFRVHDADGDDLLNDEELCELQQTAFDMPLKSSDIDAIKNVLLKKNEKCLDATRTKLTFEGFCALQLMFIEKNKMDTPWTLLRSYGYDNDLKLRDDYVPQPPARQTDQSYELTPEVGLLFLFNTFARFDHDQDGVLSPDELENVFFGSPSVPFPAKFQQSVACDPHGNLTLPGWISTWGMLVFFEPRVALRSLVYLGCLPDQAARAIRLTGPKSADRHKDFVDRETLHCLVFGSPRSGKSSLLRRLIGKKPPTTHIPTKQLETVAQLVDIDPEDQGEKTTRILIMTEVPAIEELSSEIIEQDLPRSDLVVLMYDQSDPRSLIYVQNLLQTHLPHDLPHILLASKVDKPSVQQIDPQHQDAPLDALELARSFDISLEPCDSFSEDLALLFPRLVESAIIPSVSLPSTPTQRRNRLILRYLKRSLLLSACAGIAWFTANYLRTRFVPSSSSSSKK